MSAVRREMPKSVDLRQKERRRNRRVPIALNGRFLDHNSEDKSLITQNVSCSGALVQSTERPPEGARIVCYFDDLGRVSATVARRTANGFAVSFQTTQHKRDKLADKLTWLINRAPFQLEEERRAPRYAAAGGPALVRRADGKDIQCRVTDISLTGASFYTDAPLPMIGEIVMAGALSGMVVRCQENLFAVRFLVNPET